MEELNELKSLGFQIKFDNYSIRITTTITTFTMWEEEKCEINIYFFHFKVDTGHKFSVVTTKNTT